MSIRKISSATTSIILEAKIKASFAEISNLVLDTGATYVMIPWKLALAVKLNIDPAKTVKITSATTLETVPKVIIPEMKVLGKTAKNVEAVIKDLPPGVPADGLLGLSFLKHFKLTMDFKKGILALD